MDVVAELFELFVYFVVSRVIFGDYWNVEIVSVLLWVSSSLMNMDYWVKEEGLHRY